MRRVVSVIGAAVAVGAVAAGVIGVATASPARQVAPAADEGDGLYLVGVGEFTPGLYEAVAATGPYNWCTWARYGRTPAGRVVEVERVSGLGRVARILESDVAFDTRGCKWRRVENSSPFGSVDLGSTGSSGVSNGGVLPADTPNTLQPLYTPPVVPTYYPQPTSMIPTYYPYPESTTATAGPTTEPWVSSPQPVPTTVSSSNGAVDPGGVTGGAGR